MRIRFMQLPQKVLFWLLVGVFLVGLFAYAATPNRVTIVVDGSEKQVNTHLLKVRGILLKQGVSLEHKDVVEPGLESYVSNRKIVVKKAKLITLQYNQIKENIFVYSNSVEGALNECGFSEEAVKNSRILAGKLKDRAKIRIATLRTLKQVKLVYFDSQGRIVENPKQKEKLGKKKLVIEKKFSDELLLASTVISEKVLEKPYVAPRTRLVARSNRDDSREESGDSNSSEISPSWKKLTVVATAYAPGAGAGYITATGAKAGRGIIAVDPDVIPLGTKLYVPGYGYGVAADTGGAINGKRIDLCFDTRSKAMNWGRRTVNVYIVK